MSVDNSTSQGIIQSTSNSSGGSSSSGIFEIESFPAAWIQATDDVATYPNAGNWLSYASGRGFYAGYKSFCWIVPVLNVSTLHFFQSIEYPASDYTVGGWHIWGGKLADSSVFTLLAEDSIPDLSAQYGKMVQFSSSFSQIDISGFDCLKIAMDPGANTSSANLSGFYEPIMQGVMSVPSGNNANRPPLAYLGAHAYGAGYSSFPVFDGQAQNLLTKWMKIGLAK